jgi:hypothetical protein
MDGSLFFSPRSFPYPSEQSCPECGQMFQARTTGAGAEELCDTCYEAQFQPLKTPRWKTSGRRPRALRLPGMGRPRRPRGWSITP